MNKLKTIIAILMSLTLGTAFIPYNVNAWNYNNVCINADAMPQSLEEIKSYTTSLSGNISPRLMLFMKTLINIIDELLTPYRDGNAKEFQDLLLNVYNYLNNLRDYLMGSQIDNLKVLGRKKIYSVSSFVSECVTSNELANLEFLKNPQIFTCSKDVLSTNDEVLTYKYTN